jgi:hypothetical protein
MATSNPSLHLDHPRDHKMVAGILTSVGIGLAILLGFFFGVVGVFSSAVALSLPLLLIWGAADVTRADE